MDLLGWTQEEIGEVVGLKIEELIEKKKAKERQATSQEGIYGGKPLVEKLPQAVIGKTRKRAG